MVTSMGAASKSFEIELHLFKKSWQCRIQLKIVVFETMEMDATRAVTFIHLRFPSSLSDAHHTISGPSKSQSRDRYMYLEVKMMAYICQNPVIFMWRSANFQIKRKLKCDAVTFWLTSLFFEFLRMRDMPVSLGFLWNLAKEALFFKV